MATFTLAPTLQLTYSLPTKLRYPFLLTLPVTGTITSINWGDGSAITATRSYTSAGTYTINILGNNLSLNHYGINGAPYLTSCTNLSSCTNLAGAFSGCSKLTSVPTTIPAVTDLSYMFYNCEIFNQDISMWITSTVTSMKNMFEYASSFNQTISNWDTSNVTTMRKMFFNASAFNQNVGNWNYGLVTNMNYMFRFSGITTTTYDAMLTSWSSSLKLRSNSRIGVQGLTYKNTDSRTVLTSAPNNIVFNGDAFIGYTTLPIPLTTLPTVPPTTRPISHVICFLEGTYIYTNNGYELIENLKKGDLVNTFKDDYVPIHTVVKQTMYHDSSQPRNKNQLFHLSYPNYPTLLKDLYITGAHSVLVGQLTDTQKIKLLEEYKKIHVTDLFYRLPVYLDEKAEMHVTGSYTIYHLVLEHVNIHFNYGIYANGLLVESLSMHNSI